MAGSPSSASVGPDHANAARDPARRQARDSRFRRDPYSIDKSCILDRCTTPDLRKRSETVAAKLTFTEEDIWARARRTLATAIVHGTTRMRAQVEVDPRIGLKGFRALSRLKRDYAWAVDIQVCVFPQEGLLNDPGCDELLVEACDGGADLIGGCPYTDSDPCGQIARIFDLGKRYDIDIDFHLDFDLDPSWMQIEEVCRQTAKFGKGGHVAIGHVTKRPRGHAALELIDIKLANAPASQ